MSAPVVEAHVPTTPTPKVVLIRKEGLGQEGLQALEEDNMQQEERIPHQVLQQEGREPILA